jgi:hypothetical protein
MGIHGAVKYFLLLLMHFIEGGFKFEAQRALVIDETPLRVF